MSSRYPPADRRRRPQQGAGSPALAIEQQRAHFPLWCPIRVAQLPLVHALDVAGHPGPSRGCPWPRVSLVPDPGCRQACSTG
ncbi:hypothetical protein, partial [Aeromonas caviae]|uniref:hypothetical protein n=1 Tax=Aeromonas caviae TaxID=648 RepID=UPI0029DE79F0